MAVSPATSMVIGRTRCRVPLPGPLTPSARRAAAAATISSAPRWTASPIRQVASGA